MYNFSDISGDHAVFGPGEGFVGKSEKIDWSWPAGARIGYLVIPVPDLFQRRLHRGARTEFVQSESMLHRSDRHSGFRAGTIKGWFRRQRFRIQLGWIPGPVREDRRPVRRIRPPRSPRVCHRCAAVARPATSTRARCSPTSHTELVLPLQLGWPGRRQVLISAKSAAQKPRHRPGLFCCLRSRAIFRTAFSRLPPPPAATGTRGATGTRSRTSPDPSSPARARRDRPSPRRGRCLTSAATDRPPSCRR